MGWAPKSYWSGLQRVKKRVTTLKGGYSFVFFDVTKLVDFLYMGPKIVIRIYIFFGCSGVGIDCSSMLVSTMTIIFIFELATIGSVEAKLRPICDKIWLIFDPWLLIFLCKVLETQQPAFNFHWNLHNEVRSHGSNISQILS